MEKAHVVAHRETNSTSSEEYLVLHSNHEETNTKIILHAIHATYIGAVSIVICSQSIYRCTGPSFASPSRYTCTVHLFIHWTRGKTYITQEVYSSVHTVCPVETWPACSDDFSGCDTVSTFHIHVKGTAFRLMMQQSEYFQPLGSMDEQLEISRHQMKVGKAFVGRMHDEQGQSLNELRCKMAKSQRKVPVKKLPIIEDSFAFAYTLSTHDLETSNQIFPTVTRCSQLWL